MKAVLQWYPNGDSIAAKGGFAVGGFAVSGGLRGEGLRGVKLCFLFSVDRRQPSSPGRPATESDLVPGGVHRGHFWFLIWPT